MKTVYKLQYYFFLIFISALGFSCKKESNGIATDGDYVKGEILIGIDSSLQLEQIFTTVNAQSLSIEQATGFIYTTTIPKDSILYIVSILNSRPYIDINTTAFSGSVWAHYRTEIVHVSTTYWDMGLSNQQDFIQTKNLLRMTDKLSPYKNMRLKVPQGQEEYWINKFKTFSWVTWAELNWYSRAQPDGE